MGVVGLDVAAFVISSASFAFNTVWTPFATHRAAQARLAFDVKRQYVQDYQTHLDTLYAYKAKHGDAYIKYWREHMGDGLPSDNEEKQVDNARRLLREFWKEVFDYREYGNLAKGWKCLPAPLAAWGPPDVLSGNFMRRAVAFQELVEPLDVANWYRLKAARPERFVGEYMDEGCKGRDKCFKGIDACREQAGKHKEVADWHNKLVTIAEGCKAAAHDTQAPGNILSPQEQSVDNK